MKEKLQLLMNRLEMRPGQFARTLDVNPAIISHILAERNKPGVDLLQKILARFPQVSPDWLLLGVGGMFREDPGPTQQAVEPTQAETPAQNLFSPSESASSESGRTAAAQSAATDAPQPTIQRSAAATGKTVSRVVLFYADGTFDSFIPGKLPEQS